MALRYERNKMSEMIVKLKWDGEDLGPFWMNLDNLKLLLYGKEWSTKETLVQIEEISHSEREVVDAR